MLFLAVLVQALAIEGHTEVIYLNITETHDSFNNSFLNGVFLMLAFLSGIIIFLILFDILHMLQIQLVPRSPLERFKKKRKTTRIEVASKTIP
ncbi:hypothetical protein L596_015609 [Steinernema carpocapsae]|uniref:Uncharacterized protein n=1 Tax=Steinernema carpocapsae TaxID=34508 RepID=A0A4U5NGR1_STECR|nr:hypothetical protein L596_015609 [Steinernema carpocapsae]